MSNSKNNHWFSSLYEAIDYNDLEKLNLALENPNTNINIIDEWGETPLLRSLKRKRSNSFIMQLIRAGCDVNIANKRKLTTPLHVAISLSLNDVACELLKKGANVNAGEEQEWDGNGIFRLNLEEELKSETPLHYAIWHNNLEGVCMLLYYGADVYIMSSTNITPLKYVAHKKLDEIVKILINYYDESYYLSGPVTDYFGRSPFIPCGFNLEHEIIALLTCSINCQNAELFKLFWNMIDFENILNHQDSNVLLVTFLEHSCFASSDWLEYLHLILNIFVTRQFTINYESHLNFFLYHSRRCGVIMETVFSHLFTVFSHLFTVFQKRNIELLDRLAIMSIYLNLGAPIHLPDVEEALKRYGFNEELEILIYASNFVNKKRLHFISSFSPFILAIEENLDDKSLCELFKSYFVAPHPSSVDQSYQLRVPIDYFVSLLGFFSLPADVKQQINNCCSKSPEILEKLKQVPEFPTLLELSRNKARKYIKEFNNIKYPYQFHDAVKKLNLPKVVEYIIRFKTPLY